MSSEKYRASLNLLKTDFPIRPEFERTDKEIQNKWENIDINSLIKNINKNNKSYVLHDGPPYANGDIHLGHAYNKILKDIVSKSRRMFGFNCNIIPGWDCHGLPIEKRVSTEHPEYNKIELKKECREYASGWITKQMDSFKKLGVFMDWKDRYATMDYSYESVILDCFAEFVNKGFMFRARKVIPWCIECKTALASAEIEYKDRKDPSIYALFEFNKIPDFLKNFISESSKLYCMIWTTTPWTLPLNRGVMLKTNGNYALVKSQEKFIIVGLGCIDHLKNITGFDYQIIKEFNSVELSKSTMNHVLDDSKKIGFVYDDSVEDKEGTACIHTAPGCGQLDYEVGIKNGLEVYSPISDDGKYLESIYLDELKNISINDGQWIVLKKLSEKGLLWFKNSIKHSYPHCWRCRNGLIFRATPQWFCSLQKNNLKENALSEIQKIKFFPSAGKNFLEATVGSRWEWCLSRQRAWGTPIPALISEDNEHMWTSSEFIKHIASGVRKEGFEYWDKLSIEEILENDNFKNEIPKNIKWKKEDNILDVWFDSGVSHTAVLKERNIFPASIYLEGIDQHRGWFQSSLLTSVALYGCAPMETILTHGFVVDEKGQKMSKSLGNGVEPQDIIKKVGTDGLRLWVSSISNEGDAVYSLKVMENIAEVYRKIRNTCRFILQNISDFNFEKDKVSLSNMREIDIFACKKMYEVSLKCMNNYYKMQFSQIYHTLADFSVSFLSALYFDVSKDILYCDEVNSLRRRSAQTALYIILDSINRLIAPIMSHTSDLIYNEYSSNKNDSIHLKDFYKFDFIKELGNDYYFSKNLIEEKEIEEKIKNLEQKEINSRKNWDTILKIRDYVLKEIELLREKNIVKQGIETSIEISIPSSSKYFNEWNIFTNKILDNKQNLNSVLEELFLVSEVKISNNNSEKDILCSVKKHEGKKCERCWKYYFEGNNELCNRCITVVNKNN